MYNNATGKRKVKDLLYSIKNQIEWKGSGDYWQKRYLRGGNSGNGSYGKLAHFKAEVINHFVEEKSVKTVIEWGCGDGNQLKLANYPQYIGYDISSKAISICREKFKKDTTKRFECSSNINFYNEFSAELSLSLDVLYHLIEDDVYKSYMKLLFESSTKYVCIYSCNYEDRKDIHVRCRKFTDYVDRNFPEWHLIKYIKNRYPVGNGSEQEESWSDFYFYEKCTKNND